ncbi:stalk domain-containing protein [Paenibacillus sp. GCM10027629]|uniref:stalk domain-containing protein n=1 Tax=Paenibacillus sp. GCM10027629 TaxID=3273414 RepID=UPI00363B9460
MRKWLCMILAIAVVLSLNTSIFAAPASMPSALDPQGDIAKMYRVNHEMKFDLQGKSALLDGKSIAIDKPILKNGRIYVSLRTLGRTSAGVVSWSPTKQTIRVIMNKEIRPPFQDLMFRIGSDRIYLDDKNALLDEKIPKPFISKGTTYIPVSALKWLGISVSVSDNTMSWAWSNKIIEVLLPHWETDQSQATFTMLYQQDMYTPQYMYTENGGGWSGEAGKVIAKNISIDGRIYNRMQLTADLKPSMNVLLLTAVSVGEKKITVMRKVADPSKVPVQITKSFDDRENLSFTQPTSGYFHVKPNEKIELSGDILFENDRFDKLTVQVLRYDDKSADSYQSYQQMQQFEIPIKNQKFSGSFTLSQKGYYYIQVLSPKYIATTEHGSAMTTWAYIFVDVE